MKTRILVSIAVLSLILGVGSIIKTSVFADEELGKFPPVIQAIIDKFNLNEGEVADVIEEQHQIMHQNRLSEMENRLDTAVVEGKLSQEQRDKLLQKLEEQHTNMEAVRDMSPEERKIYMEEHKDDLHTWAEENGIDLFELKLGRGGFKFGGSEIGSGLGGLKMGRNKMGTPKNQDN